MAAWEELWQDQWGGDKAEGGRICVKKLRGKGGGNSNCWPLGGSARGGRKEGLDSK